VRSRINIPSQRETITTGAATEIRIPLRQAFIAWCCAIVAWFLVLRWAIAPTLLVFADWFPEFAPHTPEAHRIIWQAGFYLISVAVLFSVASSMLTNVYDQRWPPTHQASPSHYGPSAPDWLRRAMGWREREPDNMMNFEAPHTPPITQNHTVTADLLIGQLGGKMHHPRPTLELDEWTKLAAVFRAGNSVSVRDLQKHKFSQDAAKRVNREVCGWPGLTERDPQKRNKPFPVESFKEWVLEGHYRDGLAVPSPLIVPTHTK